MNKASAACPSANQKGIAENMRGANRALMTEMIPPNEAHRLLPVETPRQRLCRELKERVDRGEYWVDLGLLASLLVDCQAHRKDLEDNESG